MNGPEWTPPTDFASRPCPHLTGPHKPHDWDVNPIGPPLRCPGKPMTVHADIDPAIRVTTEPHLLRGQCAHCASVTVRRPSDRDGLRKWAGKHGGNCTRRHG